MVEGVLDGEKKYVIRTMRNNFFNISIHYTRRSSSRGFGNLVHRYYGNTGCGVFKRGGKIRKIFA